MNSSQMRVVVEFSVAYLCAVLVITLISCLCSSVFGRAKMDWRKFAFGSVVGLMLWPLADLLFSRYIFHLSNQPLFQAGVLSFVKKSFAVSILINPLGVTIGPFLLIAFFLIVPGLMSALSLASALVFSFDILLIYNLS